MNLFLILSLIGLTILSAYLAIKLIIAEHNREITSFFERYEK